MKRLLLLVLAATLLLAAPTTMAFVIPGIGGRTDSKFETTGTIAKKGRQVQVTILLTCDRVQNARVRVTVTQDGGANAHKRKKVRCATASGSFPLRAKARGRHRFVAGAATACALVRTNDDATQWCTDVTLAVGPKT